MKYEPPYGISDPDAPYVNGDPSIARQGSIPPAEAFEHPQREIINVITKNGFIPTSADLTQMLQGNRSQFVNYANDTGSVNTLSVAFDPPLVKYTVGLPIRVRVNATNTGGATIDAGAGRVAIMRPDGSNMQAGDMPAGGIVELVYDGSTFQMVNYLGNVSQTSVVNNYNQIPYCADTSVTANQIVAPFNPAISTVKAGDVVLIKVANTTTGPTTVKINTLPPVPVKAYGLAGVGNILPCDIYAADIKMFVYDGTEWVITPNITITIGVNMLVPSQYASVANVMNQLSRKKIAPNGYVNIVLAAGQYAPFSIQHADADRIIVSGTMLAAAPGLGNFQRTGWDDGSRYNDAWANLPMLRSRYGTEIHCTASSTIGIQNIGPGMPQIKDILCTGNYTNDGTYGVSVSQGARIQCNNVCCWGMGWNAFGSWNGAVMYISNCISCATWSGAAEISASGSQFASAYSMMISGGNNGANSDYHSSYQSNSSNCQYFLYDGWSAWIQSNMTLGNCSSGPNGRYDLVALVASTVVAYSCAYDISKTNPYQNTEGNQFCLISTS
jgi:hypothetical protein